MFPTVTVDSVLALLRERRFVVLEGPPGTGKTRLAYQLADLIGHSTHTRAEIDRTAGLDEPFGRA